MCETHGIIKFSEIIHQCTAKDKLLRKLMYISAFFWQLYTIQFCWSTNLTHSKNKFSVRISGSQFAICYRVLLISEWPFVLFSKIANG